MREYETYSSERDVSEIRFMQNVSSGFKYSNVLIFNSANTL